MAYHKSRRPKGKKRHYNDSVLFKNGRLKYRRSDFRPRHKYNRGRRQVSMHLVPMKDRSKFSSADVHRVASTSAFFERELRREIKGQLIERDGMVYAISGNPFLNKQEITLDHIIPLSRGGKTTISNCQLAHLKCNQTKSSKFDPELYPSQKYCG